MIAGYKIGITLTLLLIGVCNAISQEVIAAAGNYSENYNGSVSWVLGEVIQSNMATLSNETEKINLENANTSSLTDESSYVIEYAIYPNPFTDFIFISIQNDDENKPFNVNIYSISGELVYTKTGNQGDTLIPLKEIAAGNYFVQIQSEGNYSEAIKIIKSE